MKNNRDALLMKGETWKDIPNYEGLYQASNLGRIKALLRIVMRKGHLIPFPEYIIKGWYDKSGYLITKLTKNKAESEFKVHRLIGMTWIPNPENLPFINHENGVKDDNRVINLKWCNNSYNVKHSYDVLNRSKYRGEKHDKTTLSEKDILMIRELYKSGNYKQRQLAEMYNVDRTTISGITRRVRWKHIT